MADEVNFVCDGVEQRKVEEEKRQMRRQEWFAKLPSNKLSDSEDMLRKALVQYLEACPFTQSTLTNAMRPQEIRFRKVQCLPRFITISQWIQRRGHGILWYSGNPASA